MSRIGILFPRSTLQQTTDRLLSAVQRTQFEMDQAQSALSSGKSVNRPSQEAGRTPVIMVLENQLQARNQHERNLQHSIGLLNFVDQSFADVTDNLIEARSIASSQIGIGSSADTRRSEAAVIDAMIEGLIQVSNRQFQGVSLFGGHRSAALNQPVFEDFLGGVRYTGAAGDLAADVGLADPLAFNANGADGFGALSTRVIGDVDLDPQATAATRIVDVNGAQGFGVRLGSIVVSVNGTPVTLDLSTIDTLGDVVTRVNDAIDSVNPAAGALSIGGPGYDLTANAGHTISINDLGADVSAADLGINVSATGATVAGGDLDVRLTELTELAALGATVDFTGGLKIAQGGQNAIADFSAATTIQDLINEINRHNLGLRLGVNGDATGLNLVSEVSGIEMSVGENSGGTTAQDLGLRTFGLSTLLSDFRLGLGIESQQAADDFAFEVHDGRTFNVNLDGLASVGQLITAINTAATAAGLTVGAPGAGGTDFNVGLAADGNGYLFEDNTVGPNDFRVAQLDISLAATHLGINKNAGAGNTIAGDDLAKVRVESVFTHLIKLRDALASDDTAGITLAGEAIELDVESQALARAEVGVRSQRVAQQQQRSAELKTTEQSMLSELQDADFTEVITRFLQLQQQLQAALQVGSQNLQLSFLDFLR